MVNRSLGTNPGLPAGKLIKGDDFIRLNGPNWREIASRDILRAFMY